MELNTELVKNASLTQAIIRFVVDTPGHALPESARHMARLSLLDWIAVAVAGSNEPVSRIVVHKIFFLPIFFI